MTKTAEELYPVDPDSGWYTPCDYTPMIESFGEVLLNVEERSYQGSTWALYVDGGRIGYLEFGWGSCGGCDALQACSSPAEVQRLMDELRQSIKWFPSKVAALEWFNTHDWEGDWSWHEKDCRQFVAAARVLLGAGQ